MTARSPAAATTTAATTRSTGAETAGATGTTGAEARTARAEAGTESEAAAEAAATEVARSALVVLGLEFAVPGAGRAEGPRHLLEALPATATATEPAAATAALLR
jgi:hypothetical protein